MNSSEPLIRESLTLTEDLLRRITTEVRQTLHEVLGCMELISEESLSRRQIEQLSRSGESLHALLRTANDTSELVDYSSTAERSCTFSFFQLLEEFGDLVRIRTERKNLALRWNLERGVPALVLGYRSAIEFILYRLVDYSIETTLQGGIAISVKMLNREQQFGRVVIEVSDTGPGLDQSALADLCGPLSESPASGLGLRLARKQIEVIGGHVEVLSSDHRGTTVSVVIPVTIPEGGMADDPVPAGRIRNIPLQLLVAEDSDDSFAVFESFVHDEGHQVARAHNGEEAVEMFKNGNFDVVVMDVNMPLMDGYTATRTIRDWETQAGRARRPILLLSADDAGRQKRIGSAVGCSGYLTKPTPKREVLCALRACSPHGSDD